VDRQRFLKTVCGLGVCGCVASLVDAPEAFSAVPEQVPDQRLAFNRYQVAKMVGFMAAGPNAPACAEILQKTGRECAKLGQLIVTVAEGECSCPLVDSKRTPAFFCNCSVGYQKEAFEAVFGKPVQVSLKESKLGGSKRCVFEIALSPAAK
jgi:hypothetical protein